MRRAIKTPYGADWSPGGSPGLRKGTSGSPLRRAPRFLQGAGAGPLEPPPLWGRACLLRPHALAGEVVNIRFFCILPGHSRSGAGTRLTLVLWHGGEGRSRLPSTQSFGCRLRCLRLRFARCYRCRRLRRVIAGGGRAQRCPIPVVPGGSSASAVLVLFPVTPGLRDACRLEHRPLEHHRDARYGVPSVEHPLRADALQETPPPPLPPPSPVCRRPDTLFLSLGKQPPGAQTGSGGRPADRCQDPVPPRCRSSALG